MCAPRGGRLSRARTASRRCSGERCRWRRVIRGSRWPSTVRCGTPAMVRVLAVVVAVIPRAGSAAHLREPPDRAEPPQLHPGAARACVDYARTRARTAPAAHPLAHPLTTPPTAAQNGWGRGRSRSDPRLGLVPRSLRARRPVQQGVRSGRTPAAPAEAAFIVPIRFALRAPSARLRRARAPLSPRCGTGTGAREDGADGNGPSADRLAEGARVVTPTIGQIARSSFRREGPVSSCPFSLLTVM